MQSLADHVEGATLEAELRHFCATAREGTPLLPERQMAERYGLTHAAVRKILKRLHEDGVIHREQGRGTFVAPQEVAGKAMTIIYVDTWQQLGHPYYMSRLRGIMAEARRHNLRLQVFDGPPVETADLYANVAHDDVAGVILPFASEALDVRLRQANPRLAIVSTGYATALTTITHVAVDYQSLGAMAATYLLRHGARRPLGICGHRDAQRSFEATCNEAGVHGRTIRVDASKPPGDDLAAGYVESPVDGLAFDDEICAAAVYPLIAPVKGPVITQVTQGVAPPIAQAAILEVDGFIMGRHLVETLHAMIHDNLYHNAIIRVRPKLIGPTPPPNHHHHANEEFTR